MLTAQQKSVLKLALCDGVFGPVSPAVLTVTAAMADAEVMTKLVPYATQKIKQMGNQIENQTKQQAQIAARIAQLQADQTLLSAFMSNPTA